MLTREEEIVLKALVENYFPEENEYIKLDTLGDEDIDANGRHIVKSLKEKGFVSKIGKQWIINYPACKITEEAINYFKN